MADLSRDLEQKSNSAAPFTGNVPGKKLPPAGGPTESVPQGLSPEARKAQDLQVQDVIRQQKLKEGRDYQDQLIKNQGNPPAITPTTDREVKAGMTNKLETMREPAAPQAPKPPAAPEMDIGMINSNLRRAGRSTITELPAGQFGVDWDHFADPIKKAAQ